MSSPQKAKTRFQRLKYFGNIIVNTLVGKIIYKLAIIIIGGITLATPFFITTVQENELVTVVKFGRTIETPVKPGLKLYYPFINQVYRFDLKQMEFAIDGSGKYPEISVITRDQFRPIVLASIHYRLNPLKGKEIYYNFGLHDSEAARDKIEGRIENEVRHAIQNLCPQYNMYDLINNRFLFEHNIMYVLGFNDYPYLRDTIDQKGNPVIVPKYDSRIQIPGPLSAERLSELGIEINYIQIEYKTPEAYTQKRRLNTDLQNIKQLKEKELAELDREFERLRKKGEIAPFVLFIEKWDGRLPNSLILDENFIKLIKEKKGTDSF